MTNLSRGWRMGCRTSVRVSLPVLLICSRSCGGDIVGHREQSVDKTYNPSNGEQAIVRYSTRFS